MCLWINIFSTTVVAEYRPAHYKDKDLDDTRGPRTGEKAKQYGQTGNMARDGKGRRTRGHFQS